MYSNRTVISLLIRMKFSLMKVHFSDKTHLFAASHYLHASKIIQLVFIKRIAHTLYVLIISNELFIRLSILHVPPALIRIYSYHRRDLAYQITLAMCTSSPLILVHAKINIPFTTPRGIASKQAPSQMLDDPRLN